MSCREVSTDQSEAIIGSEGTLRFDANNWKEVPFIRGRVATVKDFNLGIAVFNIDPQGKEHYPLEIEIPDLAFLVDSITAEKRIVMVVQGEFVDGKELIGYREFSGGEGVCLSYELEEASEVDLESLNVE